MTIRRLLFWAHLIVGVFAGIVIVIMSLTGVALMYERQILAWTSRYEVIPPSPGSSRLPIADLLVSARRLHFAAPPSHITLRRDTDAVAIGFGRAPTLYLDPYTGELLGDGSSRARAFFRTMTDWHRWLGVAGEGRDAARAVTGASNLAFLFLVASGFYLWWPRAWTWRNLKTVVLFRGGLRSKARDFNWHNVFGFWMSVPLFLVVLSATVISYPWASDLAYRAVGEDPPARGVPSRGGPPRGAPPQAADVVAGDLDSLLAQAQRQVPGWRTVTLQIPATVDTPVSFAIDAGMGGEPHKRSTLTLNPVTGEVIEWATFGENSLGRRLRTLLRFLHTGEVAGFAGQTVAGIASAAAVMLVWTGFSLAIRRFFAWRARRRASFARNDRTESRAA